MNSSEKPLVRAGRWLLSLVLAVFGLCMGGGGIWLIALGGNWYYAIAGLLSLGSAMGLARRRPSASLGGAGGTLPIGAMPAPAGRRSPAGRVAVPEGRAPGAPAAPGLI